MEIKIELDLPAIISAAVSAERIQPIVDKAVSDAIRSAIGDATGYRSAFSEAMKTQLTGAMPHGLALDDMAKFQHVLNAAMTSAVHGANSDTINAALAKAVQSVLPDVQTAVKMSELLVLARDDFGKDRHESFYAYFDASEYGGGWLYLDSDPSPGGTYTSDSHKQYKANFSLAFNEKGEVYSLKMKGSQITLSARPNVINKFDSVLLAMYVGRTRLDIDIDSDDVESAACAQDD